MANLTELVERLSQLTVLEAAELARLLEKKWGVSASAVGPAPVPTMVNPSEPVEEQTEFQVSLESVQSDKRIAVIKEIRSITGLGLKEAKEFVESAPKIIRENANKEEAMRIKAVIEAAGGTVEIK